MRDRERVERERGGKEGKNADSLFKNNAFYFSKQNTGSSKNL